MTASAIRKPKPGAASAELPLCIDLDGTLIHTDTLAEAVLSACGDPRMAVAFARLPVGGRATFKQEVAQLSRLDVGLLPYNEEFIAYLQGQKAAGRYLVLATAADRAIAEAVAGHLGIFDEVIASCDGRNLKGARKAEALCERFGEAGFVYAGNDVSDIAVWKRAARAILVNTSEGLARRVERQVEVEGRFAGPARSAKTLLKALRPHQWLKNLLVFVPIFTAHAVMDLTAWWHAVLTFAAFCATASSIYLVNDATDLAADRKHPRKRKRPLASGALSAGAALGMAAGLAASGITLSALTGTWMVLAVYAAMSVSYSLKLKEMPLVDVFLLGGLYTIRIYGGGVATGHELSLWLLGFSGFLFLGLALLKRVTELSTLRHKQERFASRRGYSTDDLPILMTFGCASSFASSVVLALFVQREAAAEQYASPGLLWGVVPLMLFWQCRLWLSTARGYMHDDPIVYSGRDWVSWLVGASVMLLLLVAHSVAV
jgi:4-hydroxybenzoate polyprenyltransferase